MPDLMKAITLWQPWASLVAVGAKGNETRSWSTNYRGPIAIHAAKRRPDAMSTFDKGVLKRMVEELMKGDAWRFSRGESGPDALASLPRGCVVATAVLEAVVKTEDVRDTLIGSEYWFGDYSDGRYAWIFSNVRSIIPVPATGRQGLWNWDRGR